MVLPFVASKTCMNIISSGTSIERVIYPMGMGTGAAQFVSGAFVLRYNGVHNKIVK